MGLAIKLAESGNLPDSIVRQGIRQLVKQRLVEISANNCEIGMANLTEFVAAMNASAIAPVPELANAQHYEVPAAFFHY